MNQKYESELLYDLMKRDGDNTPSGVLPYESELKEKYINQVIGVYPKLTDYRPEWLNYNLYHHLPSDFPVETVTGVTKASFQNVVPYAYGKAMLKGQTLVNLVPEKIIDHIASSDWDGYLCLIQNSKQSSDQWRTLQDLKPNTKYYISCYVETFEDSNEKNYCLNNPSEETIFEDSMLINGVGHYQWLSTTKSELTNEIFIVLRSQNANARGAIKIRDIMIIEYQDGMKNWDIPYFEGMQSVKMPALTTTNEDGTKTIILTVNEDVMLRSNGSVCDELDCLSGQLTQRIGEDGVVLSQEVVKTVDLTCLNEQGVRVDFMPIEGTMHVNTSSQTLPPLLDMSVPVEPNTQNLNSFANMKEE